MRAVLPFLITGTVTGSLYGLAGLGLVLTYRTSGVFNFGHGAVAAAAAFLFYTLHTTHHLAWPLAALITIGAFATVVGLVLERITRDLGDVPQAVVVVATVGLLLFIQGLLYLWYGTGTRQFPDFLPTSGFTLSGVTVTWAQTLSIVLASGSTVGLYTFLRRSRLGVAMRAVVDNPTLVCLTGDRPTQVRRAAWVAGSAFAALSGILLAPTLGLDALLLTLLVVQAFGACAIGLFSSLPLTYAGGLAVGVLASLSTKYLTDPVFNGVPATVPFLVLLAVLLIVPLRRFPQRSATIRGRVTARPPLNRRRAAALVVAAGTGLLFVPSFVGTKLPVWTSGLTYVVIFGSLALLVWTSGQISLCHMSFAAVGATTMAHFNDNMPWVLALFLAGLLTAPVGALVAIPAIRLSGIYLALATLGFGILMQNVVFSTSLMFGSQLVASTNRPQLGFIDGTSDQHLYYIVLAVAALHCLTLAAISRSRLGRLLRAMAETPTMLSTHGLGVNMTRLIVFCVSAFFAGVGGALAITQFGAANSLSFGSIQSLLLLAVLAMCGTRLLPSTIIAATLYGVLPGYATGFTMERQILAFGAAAIVASLITAKRPEIQAWLRRAASETETRLAKGPVRSRFERVGAVPVVPEAGGSVQ